MTMSTAWEKPVDNRGQFSYPQIGHKTQGKLTTEGK